MKPFSWRIRVLSLRTFTPLLTSPFLVCSFERKFVVVSSGLLSCTKPKMLSFRFHVSVILYNGPISFHIRSHKPSNSILTFFLFLLITEQMKAYSCLFKSYSCCVWLAKSTAGQFPAVPQGRH